jgi:hypothetical protein
LGVHGNKLRARRVPWAGEAMCVGSLNLSDIVEAQRRIWFAIPLLPMFEIFFISGLAETNRSPFDLVEGETELVAGYFVEYSAMAFALFYLGGYVNMILISAMTSVLFLGGWLAPFGVPPFTLIPGTIWFLLKIAFVLFCFLWVRATFPRFRYDQLMRLGWKALTPPATIHSRSGMICGCGAARMSRKTTMPSAAEAKSAPQVTICEPRSPIARPKKPAMIAATSGRKTTASAKPSVSKPLSAGLTWGLPLIAVTGLVPIIHGFSAARGTGRPRRGCPNQVPARRRREANTRGLSPIPPLNPSSC